MLNLYALLPPAEDIVTAGICLFFASKLSQSNPRGFDHKGTLLFLNLFYYCLYFLSWTTFIKVRQLRSFAKCLDYLIGIIVYIQLSIRVPFTKAPPRMQGEQYIEADQLTGDIPSNWSITFGWKSLCDEISCLVSTLSALSKQPAFTQNIIHGF